jgi:hypothetical protein
MPATPSRSGRLAGEIGGETFSGRRRKIAAQLGEHERSTGSLLPHRATVHDVGTCLTHKRLICWKRYAEGKDPHLIARETYHSLMAVNRHLAQVVRDPYRCSLGMQAKQIAYTLSCGQRLVEEYLQIHHELEARS